MSKDNQQDNITENPVQQSTPPQTPQGTQPPMPEPKKSSGMGIIIFIILVGVVVVIGFKEHLFKYFTGHKNESKHQEISKSIATPADQHDTVPAENHNSMTTFEKQQIENIVKEYIQNNPEVILNSLKNMEQKVAKERSEKAQDYIKNNISSINANKPYLGNKNGTVVITKFFDYKCGYCKKAHAAIETLIKSTPNLKVVLIELPIMGPQSMIATQASLAAFDIAPTKFAKFNSDLMALPSIDENAIKQLAAQHNINAKNLLTTMKSQKVEQQIDANMNVAREVGIQGVPAFIIGDEFIPGFIDSNALKAKIENLQKQQ